MACGSRREPEGIYGNEEDAISSSTRQGIVTSPQAKTYWSSSSYYQHRSSDDDENSLSQQLNSVSLNEAEPMAPSQDWSWNQNVSVCLHQGSPGISPVLITLPFQDSDNLQNFVPCTVCHLPNVATPGPGADDAIAFCVSEVNIRTSQLILVPCYVCWRSRPVTGMPEQIKVPLFHSTLNGGMPTTSQTENSLRFVPCNVCLIPEHSSLIVDISPPHLESRSQQTSLQEIETNQSEGELIQQSLQYPSVSWFIPFSHKPEGQSLQMAFLLHCKEVVTHVRQRQKELPQKASIRLQGQKNLQAAQRTHQKTEIPVFTSYQPFSHTQMRNHTERWCRGRLGNIEERDFGILQNEIQDRIYKNLPEVKEQRVQRLLQQTRKTHRIMAYIFQKKLQQATLRGKVSWLITESCM